MQTNRNDPFGFDFGFTMHDETEFSNATDIEEYEERIKDLEFRLEEMYETILPLLTHLRSNPERAMIHWPNRAPIIDQFEERLKFIRDGE